MATKYLALLTNIGAAKLAKATALGTKVEITQMAVGDGNGVLPTPNPAQTALVHELRRATLNMLTVDPANASQIVAEQVVPEDVGGWWIREIGLFDKDGDMVAIANCAETYKPQLQEGSGRVQVIRVILIVSSTEAVTIKIDPSVVLATRKYVDDKIIEVKAYADDLLVDHIEDENPHSQYPLIANALKEMADAGLVDKVLENLGLVTNGFIGRLVNVITITSSETYTPTEGVKKVIIEACGGGGGGGAALATAASQSAVGTGGSSGDYIRTPFIDAETFEITIGSGGAGGNGSVSASSGGSTTVGSIISCRGGPGGSVGVASSVPLTSNTGGGFTGSLTAPEGSVVVSGGIGVRGFIVNPGSATGQVAGTGGSTPLGHGADGQQAAAGNSAPVNSYGCGGAGGSNTASSTAKSGGDGASGVVIIREYA